MFLKSVTVFVAPSSQEFQYGVMANPNAQPALTLLTRWEVIGVDGATKLLDAVLEGLTDQSKVTACVVVDCNLTNGDFLEARLWPIITPTLKDVVRIYAPIRESNGAGSA